MLEIVSGINDTDGAGARAHDYRLGGRAAGKKMTPLKLAAAGPSLPQKHPPPRRQVFDENLLFDIFHPIFFAPLIFPSFPRLQPPLHPPPAAPQPSSPKTPSRRPADTH